jgi:hypothetical protein
MPREKFGLVLHYLGEMGFERFSDTRVQLLPRAPQQGAVCGVLDKRVLEKINGIGEYSALEHQACIDEPTERILQLCLTALRDYGQ